MAVFVKLKGTRAYTLIELALVMMVVGVLMSSAMAAYRDWQKNAAVETTAKNLDFVMDAVSTFLAQRGRYPCPAPLNAARTAAGYGKENCAPATVLAGNFDAAGGYWVEENGGDRVRRGALPFRTLNLPEALSEDGYHSRLQYVVTEALSAAATYTLGGGKIEVVDIAGAEVVDDPLHFLIFSSGEDRAGAYSHDGKQSILCATVTLDAENCNTAPGVNATPVYRFIRQGFASGANHFDDVVRISSSAAEPVWMAADNNGRDMHNTELTAAMGIGGMPSPAAVAAGVTLDVAANIRAQANLRAEQICDGTGAACFGAEKIAEVAGKPEMNCTNPDHPAYDPAKPYAHKIANGQIECREHISYSCPRPLILTGFTAAGTGICSDPTTMLTVGTPPIVGAPPPPPVVNGLCGLADGSLVAAAPTAPADLCSAGNPSSVGGTLATGYKWWCSGIGSGSTSDVCYARTATSPVDGVCGSANGVTTVAAPSGPALCSAGTATAVTSSATAHDWSCNGINGGINALCTAPVSVTCSGVFGIAYHYQDWNMGDILNAIPVTFTGPGTIDVNGDTSVCSRRSGFPQNWTHDYMLEIVNNATSAVIPVGPNGPYTFSGSCNTNNPVAYSAVSIPAAGSYTVRMRMTGTPCARSPGSERCGSSLYVNTCM